MKSLLLVVLFCVAAAGCVDPSFALVGDGPSSSGGWIDRKVENAIDYAAEKHVKPVVKDIGEVLARHGGNVAGAIDTDAPKAEVQKQPAQAAATLHPDDVLTIVVCTGNRCLAPERVLRRDWPAFWSKHGGAAAKFTTLRVDPPNTQHVGVPLPTGVTHQLQPRAVACRCGCGIEGCQCAGQVFYRARRWRR